MNKHRVNIFITFILVLLIIAALLAWATSANIIKSAPEETPAPSAEPTSTVEPTPTPVPTPTATPQPVPTPEPTPTNTRVIDESGVFTSNTGSTLNMSVAWNVVSENDSELTLSLDVILHSYSLNVRSHSGNIRVCGVDYPFTTDPISVTSQKKIVDTVIYSTQITVPAELGETVAIPISVSWDFGGVYHDTEIPRIVTDSTLTIQG